MVGERITKRAAVLREKLNKWCYEYFVLNTPTVSDEVYDNTFKELVDIETDFPELITPDSPTQRVGQKVSGGLRKIKHDVPMLSLDNVFSYDDLRKWAEKTKANEWVVQPKLDGLAVELVYQNGRLKHAATRGDKFEGEDVTHNIKTIKSVPLSLPIDCRIRGEVVIYKSDLLTINEEREREGQSSYVNPRNAAAGVLRNLDPKEAKKCKLKFLCYDMLWSNESYSQESKQSLCKEMSIPTAPLTRVITIDDLVTEVKKIEEGRQMYPYDIDGAVVKVNIIEHQTRLGCTSRVPRWAIAMKFKAEQAETTVRDITVQVGRTGILTPVAELEPVVVGQVTISRATLHNQEMLNEKNINVGDKVIIQRAGDVIPEVVRVSEKCSDGPFKIPINCPVCGQKVSKLPGEAAIRCVSVSCPSKLVEGLKHFVSRDCLNIVGLGDTVIDQLVEKKIVQNPYDLFTLIPLHFSGLDRMGERLALKLINSIQESRTTTLDRLIAALGIPLVGKRMAKRMADKFGTIDGFINATSKELLSMEGVGNAVVKSIKNFFDQPENMKLILDLKDILIFDSTKKSGIVSDRLKNKVFVITGNHSLPREEIKELIEQHGGRCVGSISNKVNILLAGKESGPKKLKKARETSTITIWAESDLMEAIRQGL